MGHLDISATEIYTRLASQILEAAGFTTVDSYCMHTMVWRDLDFERMVSTPDWLDHWKLGQKLAEAGWA